MAFFDLLPDEQLSPDVRRMFEEYGRLVGRETVSPTWRLYGRVQKIPEARLKAYQNLSDAAPFSWETRNFAVMLIAHAKRCRVCFASSRSSLDKLGFDEARLDAICAHPDALPLKGRDLAFVRAALKIAIGAADLKQKDFDEMAEQGLSKEDILATIGFVGYWTMNMIFSTTGLAGLTDE